jgi:hypothetical protein
MILLAHQLDEISFIAMVNSKAMVVFEWENSLALYFHIAERKLVLDSKNLEVDLEA